METPIDRAHAAMVSAGEDDAARLRFFERLADAELFLLLASESKGDSLMPELFALEDGDVALAFDLEDRITAFVERAAPFAALSGRVLVAMLAERNIGLGLNLGAGSEILLPAQAIGWMAETLRQRPDEAEGTIAEIRAPLGLPDRLIEAFSVKLTGAEGLARHAYLAGVTYEGGVQSHLLAFTGTRPGAEPALSTAISEALTFSGIEAGQIDVIFLETTDPAAARLAKVGLRFDIPVPRQAPDRAPPGSDPDTPPRLR